MRGWRGAWTPRRARRWLAAAVFAAWLPVIGMPLREWLDFSAFYAAGALVGSGDLVRLEPIVTFQAARDLPITPFVYPASVALAYLPFAALPYPLSGALHLVVMAVALVAAAWIGSGLVGLPRDWAVLGAFAWAPAAAGVVSGQNTSLALLLTVGTAASVAGRSRLGAVLLPAALAYKPQLAAPVIGSIALRGRMSGLAIAAAAVIVAVAGHYLLGVLATGGQWSWPAGWVATLRGYAGEDLEANGWQAASLPSFAAWVTKDVRWTGIAVGAAFVASGVLVAASLPRLARWPVVPALALACAVGLVANPHGWVYDATLLLPALAVLAVQAGRRGWPWQDRWLLAAAYGLALLWPLGGIIGLTPLPVVVIGTSLALLRLPDAIGEQPVDVPRQVARRSPEIGR